MERFPQTERDSIKAFIRMDFRKPANAPDIPNALLFYMLGQMYVHPAACAPCVRKKSCIGVVAGYQTLRGGEGILPFTGS